MTPERDEAHQRPPFSTTTVPANEQSDAVPLASYGAIIFYTYPGETVPHHVVIYLGGDRILEAPQTGENVRYGTLSEFPG